MDSQLEEGKIFSHCASPAGMRLPTSDLGAPRERDCIQQVDFFDFVEYIGHRVLEIGCGTGNLTRLLLEKAEEVTAIDIHAAHLESVYFNFLGSQGGGGISAF